MRFSLKWLLLAAVYVAVAAAALSQQSGLYGDVLWGMTLLVLLLAALLAIFMRGDGRIVATGFVFAGTAFLFYAMMAAPYSSATARVLMAAGYEPSGMAFPATPPVTAMPSAPTNPYLDPADPFGPSVPPNPPDAQPVNVVDFSQFVRGGNAVGVLLMGLLGALVGMLAGRVVVGASACSDKRLR